MKRACYMAGYNPREFAGHSRAGLATQAGDNGASERLIMRQTQHRSLSTFALIHPRRFPLPGERRSQGRTVGSVLLHI